MGLAETLSLRDAQQLALTLPNKKGTAEEFDITGVVVGTSRSNTEDLHLNVEIGADDLVLFCYQLSDMDSIPFKKRYSINQGDTITIRTRLENFKGVPCSYNGFLIEHRKYVDPIPGLIRAAKDKEWQLYIEAENQRFSARMFWIIFVLALCIITTLAAWTFMVWRRSRFDVLTGLLNRGSGCAEIARQMRFGRKGYYCIINIDHFKDVNDKYGHFMGDECLIMFADVLKRHFRTQHVTRLSGDEFAVYIRVVKAQAVRSLLDRFLSDVDKLRLRCDANYRISVSIGAVLCNDKNDFQRQNQLADRCLYESKKFQGHHITLDNQD